LPRIAVVDAKRCKPSKCGLECMKYCPMNKSGIEAVQIDEERDIAVIDEEKCTGCGMCVKSCPFEAVTVVNVPAPLEGEEVHRYGVNGFVLYRLPVVRAGAATGIIGSNGVGKTTVLKILSGSLLPNFGKENGPSSFNEVASMFRGHELQAYFKELAEGRIKVVVKPEMIDRIPQVVKGTVREVIDRFDERGEAYKAAELMELEKLLDRSVDKLSGGELQRLALCVAYIREADVYMFDEPSNYLDVKQRMRAAKLIRDIVSRGKAVVLVEHDLAMLDYVSDIVHILYGVPGAYGIVSQPYGTRMGVNVFLEGYLPDENIRMRREPIEFEKKEPADRRGAPILFTYGSIEVSYDSGFKLEAMPGDIRRGEVIGCVGPNGIGKTTFVVEIARSLSSSSSGVKVSYKPQYIKPTFDGTVEELLKTVGRGFYGTKLYQTEIISRLELGKLLDRRVPTLSGGELQRVAVAACLSREADIYLLDEPSAHLDVEQRYAMAKAVARRVESIGAAAIVVEHDIMTLDYLAERIVLFDGEPGVYGKASPPMPHHDGMNEFLKRVGITIRRDPSTGRPRVNKPGSRLDREMKSAGVYYW